MDILGLQLSPRLGGNSDIMLSAFAEAAGETGLEVIKFSVAERRVEPCLGCASCDATGQCVITGDDMEELYPLLARARNIVVSTSLYFYDVPAKGKALIDRSQALWARRYVLNQKEMLKPDGRGFLLALGATRGKTSSPRSACPSNTSSTPWACPRPLKPSSSGSWRNRATWPGSRKC